MEEEIMRTEEFAKDGVVYRAVEVGDSREYLMLNETRYKVSAETYATIQDAAANGFRSVSRGHLLESADQDQGAQGDSE